MVKAGVAKTKYPPPPRMMMKMSAKKIRRAAADDNRLIEGIDGRRRSARARFTMIGREVRRCCAPESDLDARSTSMGLRTYDSRPDSRRGSRIVAPRFAVALRPIPRFAFRENILFHHAMADALKIARTLCTINHVRFDVHRISTARRAVSVVPSFCLPHEQVPSPFLFLHLLYFVFLSCSTWAGFSHA